MAAHNVFAYGTLRKREERQHWMNFIHDTGRQVQVQGFLFDMGWFPALRLSDDGYSVLCDVIQVDDDGLARLDDYEGFIPDAPDHSFYVRHLVNIDGLDGFIYEFHTTPPLDQLIHGSDWLDYTSLRTLGALHRSEQNRAKKEEKSYA
jgi:gamma-glutamylcyclotransferase (GGCT)/AIG2-like uncharacterized protein YtfP